MDRRTLLAGGLAATGILLAPGAASAQVAMRNGQTPNMTAPGLALPEPWLTVPCRRRDAERASKYGPLSNISEGWFYGMERGIHGGEVHRSLDINLPFGADVLAPADGWAARTIQTWYTEHVYQGKRIGFGLGEWLITLHKVPGRDEYWWTKMAHVGWIDPTIHYLRPWSDSDGDLHEPDGQHGPQSLYLPDPELAALFTPIKRGQKLATVGDSGVEWGYRDQYNLDTGELLPRDRNLFPAWDKDVHLHLEVYRRVNGSPKPGETLDATRISIDPFGQYGQVRRWQNFSPYDGYRVGPGNQWLLDHRDVPCFTA